MSAEGAPATPAEVESADEDLLPARMLNEVVYCPRLFYLEHVAGEWDDSADTVHGRRVHRRVDGGPGELPPPEDLPEGLARARSVTVTSARAGVVAKTDLIEVAGGRVVPVDYKRGHAPDEERVPGGVWPADRVQIGAQIAALRDSGYACEEGVVYYAASKRRVPVPWTEALRDEVLQAVAAARRVRAERTPPPPLVASPKCPRCSLAGICLPDETHALLHPEAAAPDVPLRRLVPAQDDRLPLYVQAHGARIGRSGDCLEVVKQDGSKESVRLRDTSHVCVFGGVQITTAALQELCAREIGVSLFSYGGWHYGHVAAFSGKNVLLRIAQFELAARPDGRVRLAREFIAGKILNCRTLLRRNGEPGREVLIRLKELADEAQATEAEERLLGLEGTAARIYFEEFGRLLKPRSGARAAFDFRLRNRRPARDPVNAMLSFAYALLVKDARIALCAAGFDPMVGLLHRPRPGRPALALDLMEEFRPLIADSVVLTVVNNDVVSEDDFVRAAAGVALSEAGRQAFLKAYERRMAQEVTHPIFNYTVSYRQVLEVQARLLSRVVQGELETYPSFRTR
jgi:CRISPR-associated protein Cas1